VWTDEEKDILRKDRAAGLAVPVIAAKLNRPVAATYNRARIIGAIVQPHKEWLNAEVEVLKALLKASPP
ncbi:hypothetical protein, partial [Acinetobacter baumannii]|uniref:hypothetical protein n=1 Tax=Acinetobacter baumannii TaxID=470 RepID=UPI0013D3033A